MNGRSWRGVHLVGVATVVAAAVAVIPAPRGAAPTSARPVDPASTGQAGCPDRAPGTVLWHTPVSNRLMTSVAVSDQGTIVTAKARIDGSWTIVSAQDCRGAVRWIHEPLTHHTSPEGMHTIESGPAIDTRGHIGAASTLQTTGLGGNGDPEYSTAAWQLYSGGGFRWFMGWPWPADADFYGGDMLIDAADRMMVLGGGNATADSTARSGLVTFDRFGWAADFLPLVATRIHGQPVGLADGRVVLAAEDSLVTLPPAATPAPPPTPAAPDPLRARLFVPLARTDYWPARPDGAAGPRDRLHLPARLIVVSADGRRTTAMPADVSGISASDDGRVVAHGNVDLVASGDVVVVTFPSFVPRIAAFQVGDTEARLLWEHLPGQLVNRTVTLGRMDEATGRLELVYTRDDGALVSLDVPGSPSAAAGGPVTLNWAVELDAEDVSAPVLGDAGVAYVSFGGQVAAFSRQDGRELWRTRIDGAGRSTGGIAMGPDGTLYVTTFGVGTGVAAIATESEGLDPEARWPTFRHDSRRTGWATR